MYINTRITTSGHLNAFAGECPANKMRNTSLLQFLGIEFLARTDKEVVRETLKELFVLFAHHRNDKAARETLDALFRSFVSTEGSSPYQMKLSVDEFRSLRRAQEREFFTWLDETFWSLILYKPTTESERTNDTYWFVLENDLQETLSATAQYVATLWSKMFDDLSCRALLFLCDCCDSLRFEKRAQKTTAGVVAYMKENHPRDYSARFTLPEKNIEMVLSKIRSAMPTDVVLIRTWGEHAKESRAPQNVQRLFGHALVNAGADVF